MIVLDASVAVLAILQRGASRDRLAADDLHVPHLTDVEVAQALRAQVIRGTIPHPAASDALDGWNRLAMHRYAALDLLPRVWELRNDLSAYDATYVALAERLGCPLLTADRRLAAAPEPRCAIEVVRT